MRLYSFKILSFFDKLPSSDVVEMPLPLARLSIKERSSVSLYSDDLLDVILLSVTDLLLSWSYLCAKVSIWLRS